jgi:phosphoribosylamine--glycine ligase
MSAAWRCSSLACAIFVIDRATGHSTVKVLVIGKGGREHALCWKLRQSPAVTRLFCAPGNPGINQVAQPVALDPCDIAGLRDFAAAQHVDLTIVGPEEPLALGIVDEFDRCGLPIFGPSKSAARLESSKSFAKTVMREAGVPTAEYAVFDDADTACRFARRSPQRLVVKADGLALGKGVVVCDTADAAVEAIDHMMRRGAFGAAGRRVVIERRLEGEELSFFALTDGVRAVALGSAQDYKPVFDGDRGPNTGGMGAYSPTPHLDGQLEPRVMREVVGPTLAAMAARGAPFRGVLYVGLMICGDRLNVLEFNVRFGDPECEALMMRLDGDLAMGLAAAVEGRLLDESLRLSPSAAASIALVSRGYPAAYPRGLPITGLERTERLPGVQVFHAGTTLKDGVLVTNGGRVLIVSAQGDSLQAAISRAYQAADMIEFEGMHMRRDIGLRALRQTVGQGILEARRKL